MTSGALTVVLWVARAFPSKHGTPNRTGVFNTMTAKELFSFDLNGCGPWPPPCAPVP